MQMDNKFEKGEKVFTVKDLAGVFEVIEVEIYGIVYQDFDKTGVPVIFYVFDLPVEHQAAEEGAKQGARKFAKDDILFKTREEAIAQIGKMVPEYEKNYDEEIAKLQAQVASVRAAREKLVASAQDLTLSKLL